MIVIIIAGIRQLLVSLGKLLGKSKSLSKLLNKGKEG
jgi:hypothetical protein